MILKRITAYFDRITAEQDAHAASLGAVVTRRGRWSSTYEDPRAGWLAAARAGGCEHVPICALTEAGAPTCRASAALVVEHQWNDAA